MLGAVVLASLAAAGPVCGAGPGEPARRAVAEELNRARVAAGSRPLEPHPLLCRLARERADAIAATGELTGDRSYLERTTRRLYRGGYQPHFWTNAVLVGSSLTGVLEQLRTIRPEWVAEAIAGDFDHLGVGTATLDGQPVVTFMLALHRCTVEAERAAELADVEAARVAALAAVNRWRREHGREPVTRDPRLDAAAQAHAEDLVRRSYYDHRSPEGGTPGSRARAAGFGGRAGIAENIAKGLFTPTEAVDRWMESAGHRRNILRRKAAATGFGVAVGRGDEECYDVLWVQLFAG